MKETIFVLVSFWPQNSIHFYNPPSKKKKKEKKKRENDVDQVANNFMKKFWEKEFRSTDLQISFERNLGMMLSTNSRELQSIVHL